MEMKFVEEEEEFGAVNAWRLLHRSVVEGQRVTVRTLGVQGRGVLVQTSRQAPLVDGDGKWAEPEFDTANMIEDVLIMEYMAVKPSTITDGEGNPTSITRQVVGRELVGVRMAKERFQPKKKGQAKAQPGPHDHLQIMAGVVLTMETQPQQQPQIQVPNAQAQA